MLERLRPFEDPDNYLPLARSLCRGKRACLERPAHGVPAAALSPDPGPSREARRASSRCWAIALLHLALGAGTVA